MANLSQITYETRSVLKWSGLILGIIIGLFLIIKIAGVIKEIISPTPPPPPTVSFGRLPKISFPDSATNEKISYSIDTISGELPVFSDRANVFKIKQPDPDILALDKTTEKIRGGGFYDSPVQISEKVFQWKDTTSLSRVLTMNILTNDFIMSSLFLTDPIVASAAYLNNENNAIQTSKNFLSSMSSFPDDIDENKTTTDLYSISNGSLFPASSVSNSQIISVYFFQKDVDGAPIYYPKGLTSTINLLVGSGQGSATVVGANYAHQTITQESSTYPIKTAQEAFRELESGNAYISYFGGNTKENIKKVFLGYYMGEQKQNYLMPVIIFQADDGFLAYVSAIKDEWTDK